MHKQLIAHLQKPFNPFSWGKTSLPNHVRRGEFYTIIKAVRYYYNKLNKIVVVIVRGVDMLEEE
jgi:hypothetical protein